jgi:hypothetical protein
VTRTFCTFTVDTLLMKFVMLGFLSVCSASLLHPHNVTVHPVMSALHAIECMESA